MQYHYQPRHKTRKPGIQTIHFIQAAIELYGDKVDLSALRENKIQIDETMTEEKANYLMEIIKERNTPRH